MMEDLSLHVLDIVENAVSAGATRVRISVNENDRRDVLSIRVTDNGRGMSRAERERALDPFFTTGRKRTGLGLPLLAHTAEHCGGKVLLESVPGKGTRVTALFRWGHIDRPPLTKMPETLMTLLFGHPEVEFLYRHTRRGRRFTFNGRSGSGRRAAAGDIVVVRQALRSGLKRIGVS